MVRVKNQGSGQATSNFSRLKIYRNANVDILYKKILLLIKKTTLILNLIHLDFNKYFKFLVKTKRGCAGVC